MDIRAPKKEKVVIVKKKSEWSLKEFLSFVILTLIIVLPIRIYIAEPYIVSGESMEPTFSTGDYLISNNLVTRVGELHRGDIVIFELPYSGKRLIKRLIGLPGDTIKIDDGRLYISKNGEDFEQIIEEYVEFPKQDNLLIEIEENKYFLMGDNRSNSSDSRYFGAIDTQFIKGKALIRLWPLTEIDYLPGKFNI